MRQVAARPVLCVFQCLLCSASSHKAALKGGCGGGGSVAANSDLLPLLLIRCRHNSRTQECAIKGEMGDNSCVINEYICIVATQKN